MYCKRVATYLPIHWERIWLIDTRSGWWSRKAPAASFTLFVQDTPCEGHNNPPATRGHARGLALRRALGFTPAFGGHACVWMTAPESTHVPGQPLTSSCELCVLGGLCAESREIDECRREVCRRSTLAAATNVPAGWSVYFGPSLPSLVNPSPQFLLSGLTPFGR